MATGRDNGPRLRAGLALVPLLVVSGALFGGVPAGASAGPGVTLLANGRTAVTVASGTSVKLASRASLAPRGAAIWIGQLVNGGFRTRRACSDASSACVFSAVASNAATRAYEAELMVERSGHWVRVAHSRVVTVTWRSSSASQFVGDWLGPYPGSDVACGSSYSEIHFLSDGTYYTTYNTNDCGGFTIYGTYAVQGSNLIVHELRSDCGDCTLGSFTVPYNFVTPNALNINGYTYYRQ